MPPAAERSFPSQPAEPEERIDPSLDVLLHESAKEDWEQKSKFFMALKTLVRKSGLEPEDSCLKEDGITAENGYAIRVKQGSSFYVVVILRGDTHFMPGVDRQDLLLLDRDGRPLDHVSCGINSRFTQWVVGDKDKYRTDIHDPPASDGAQLVIRYGLENSGDVPEQFHNQLTHGRTKCFFWSL